MQEKVYEILKNSQGYVSGQEISKQLSVSRQAVWKAINALKEQGFVIDSVTNKGYKIIEYPKNLCKPVVCSMLNTKFTGRHLEILESTHSTNDDLKKAGHGGCENGTVIAAREQTAGKGRLGRTWLSKKDENIAFSLLLRPKLSPMEVSGITPVAGLAVCKAIREFCNIDCKIKWPNDVIVNNKKLVGILTEMSAEFDAVEYIIVGIGINTDQWEFPREVKDKATSVFLETGERVNKNMLLACILNSLEKEFLKSNYRINESNIEEYKSLCATINRTVSFIRGGKTISGKAVNVTGSGELQVQLSDGSLCSVNSGEVTIQGIY
ncbi:MAG: biotin--[acetyl-CoA-carboxylase] ligase [Ruminococcus sp.]